MNPNPQKGLYAFLAFGPVALGIIGTVPIVISVIEDQNSREPPALAIVGILIWIITAIFCLVSIIMFIVHMAKNRNLDEGARIGWIVGMIAGLFLCTTIVPWILSIVYYFLYIAKDQPTPPNGPGGYNGPNEWDTKLNT